MLCVICFIWLKVSLYVDCGCLFCVVVERLNFVISYKVIVYGILVYGMLGFVVGLV